MRILILANDFPDIDNKFISGIFIKELAKAIASTNIVEEVNVLVPVPLGAAIYEKRPLKSYRNYKIGDNLNVYFIRYFSPIFYMPLFSNMYFKLRRARTYMEVKSVSKFIQKKNIKFDIIHAHYTWPSGATAVELKTRFNVPVIVTEHTSKTFEMFVNSRDPIALDVWKRADAIIRVRKGDIDAFHKLGISTPVFYIPNGFDVNKFRPIPQNLARKLLKLPLTKKIILNVAQMYSPVKGHEILLKAFSKIDRDDILLVLVGDGKLRPSLETLARKLRIKNILFAGSRPHDEIPLWMNAADLFVLPSLSEGNPTVMFEALGVGLPFVGTTVGGVPEVITSEDYGLLCPPKNTECLAEKILIALDKEWDREKIREYAKQFTWENIAKKTLEVYNEVIRS